MELNQAQAFIAVAEELHFGRAAARLAMAQPPLTRTIQKLERQLGATLFNRTSRTVELTPAGKTLLPFARKLVTTSQAATRAVQGALDGTLGTVRLGYAGPSSNRWVAHLMRVVADAEPGIELKLESSQFSHQALAKVMAGDLEAAIGMWEYLPARISALPITDDEVLVAIPATHRLASRARVHFAELSDERWLRIPGKFSSALQNRFAALARNANVKPQVLAEVPDSYTAMWLVSEGLGCSLSLRSVAESTPANGVRFLRLADELNDPITLNMIWARDTDDAVLARLVEIANFGVP